MTPRPTRSASRLRPASHRPGPTPGSGRLSGEERAAAVARAYVRGPRRLRLTEGQLRYIAGQESVRQESVRQESVRQESVRQESVGQEPGRPGTAPPAGGRG